VVLAKVSDSPVERLARGVRYINLTIILLLLLYIKDILYIKINLEHNSL
jgi:hypothetical protein